MNHKVAYVLDPRFPGGTSSSVAQELRVAASFAEIRVIGLSTRMFSGRDVSPRIEEALADLGLEIEWDPHAIISDVVIVQNPVFLKFESTFAPSIIANRIIVVTHENFVRPGGGLAFDVDSALSMIDRASFARERVLAPISPHNRETVKEWKESSLLGSHWDVWPEDWFNICNFDMAPPSITPKDRRGRLSRPNHQKFPSLTDMNASFSPDALTNVILGGDCLLPFADQFPHWEIIPFGGMELENFFEKIDFFVYFTSKTWRESFGRVIAEAISAGKVVICDAESGAAFGDGVITAQPAEVADIIKNFVDNPTAYREQAHKAQSILKRYSDHFFSRMYAQAIVPKGVNTE